MTLSIILDIAILVILAIFIIAGIRQGFVRALCSLLAVFVAFFGAAFLARQLSPAVTDLATPHFLPGIVQRLEGNPDATPGRDFLHQDTKSLLENLGLPESWTGMVERAYEDTDPEREAFTSPSQLLGSFILNIFVFACLFILSFLLILILWAILSRSLDLVARLPILNFCNRSLGGLLGAVKGLILLLVLRWVFCDLLGLIPIELVNQTQLFRWLSAFLESTPLRPFLL